MIFSAFEFFTKNKSTGSDIKYVINNIVIKLIDINNFS